MSLESVSHAIFREPEGDGNLSGHSGSAFGFFFA